MRTKPIFLSSCLAASLWLTGCQSPAMNKLGSLGSGDAVAATKSVRNKDSLASDMGRPTTDKGPFWVSAKSPVVGPTLCATCAKCGANCGAADSTPRFAATNLAGAPVLGTAVAGAPVAACNNCIPAKTGSVVVQQPMTYTMPAAAPPNVLPHPAIVAPQSAPVATHVLPNGAIVPVAGAAPTQLPLGVSYGAGVEVVGVPANDSFAPVAGGNVNKNVMTIRFGQANNYQLVVGQVYQFRRTWKLRYTAVESDDKYGGSFTLVGDNLDQLKDGQMVRVEGAVLPSDDRSSGARYQVSRIEVIEPDVK